MTTMTWRAVMRTHVALSADPIVLREVEQIDPEGYGKPKGFWYEVNGDWRRWARGEDFTIGEHLHCVDVADCNLLQIASVEALDAFHATYRVDGPGWSRRDYTIDWRAVARLYDGIEIAPYLWQRRLDGGVDWYYTWDCASGCIWRPKSARITYLRPVRKTALKGNRAHSGSEEAPAE